MRERELIFVRPISTNHPDVNYKIGRRGATKRESESKEKEWKINSESKEKKREGRYRDKECVKR